MSGSPIEERDDDDGKGHSCKLNVIALFAITSFNAVCFCVLSFYVARMFRDYSEFSTIQKTMNKRLGLVIGSSSLMVPLLHCLNPWAFYLNSDLMNITVGGIVTVFSGISIWGVLLLELRKLTSIFSESSYKVPSYTTPMHLINLGVATSMAIVWIGFNKWVGQRDNLIYTVILIGIATVAGLQVLIGFTSLTSMFGRRLIKLVVKNTGDSDEVCSMGTPRNGPVLPIGQLSGSDNMPGHTSMVNSRSMSPSSRAAAGNPNLVPEMELGPTASTDSANDKSIRSSMDPIIMDDGSTRYSTAPAPIHRATSVFSISDLKRHSASVFHQNERKLLETVSKHFVFSVTISFGVLFIIFAYVLWSLASCFQYPAVVAYGIECLGYSLIVLRVYLSEKNRDDEYRAMCGFSHRWVLKAAALITAQKLEEMEPMSRTGQLSVNSV